MTSCERQGSSSEGALLPGIWRETGKFSRASRRAVWFWSSRGFLSALRKGDLVWLMSTSETASTVLICTRNQVLFSTDVIETDKLGMWSDYKPH